RATHGGDEADLDVISRAGRRGKQQQHGHSDQVFLHVSPVFALTEGDCFASLPTTMKRVTARARGVIRGDEANPSAAVFSRPASHTRNSLAYRRCRRAAARSMTQKHRVRSPAASGFR